MRILMISTDKKIFEENSSVRQRMFDYGTLTDELHIIVLNKRQKNGKVYKKLKLGNHVFVYPTNSLGKFTYLFDAWKISRSLKEIDLVTAQDPYETGLTGWVIAKKIKAKLELQLHTDIFGPFFRKHSWANWLRFFLARIFVHQADHLRVVSKRIKKSLPQALQEKATILPIFVSPTFIQAFQPDFSLREQYPQFKFILVAMSRLEKEKDVSLIIQALKKVVAVFPKTGLIIVGSGSLQKSLRNQARRLGLEKNVIFRRWTDRPLNYYKGADLFVLASHYEGYGLTLVEALLSHCPILTTKVGIVGEILSGNNALLCEVGDRECFSQNIINAQQHPELLKEFRDKAFADFMKKAPQTEEEVLEKLKQAWEKTIKGN